MAGQIVIQGARVHNLKNIDLEIPRDRLVVITGVSGSGKSSLAFDTLYAEGQRRYLESLSADTRQLLKQLAKPDVDRIHGLSPAIAIQQKPAALNPRSTVGTLTDIYDFLRLLFARVGQPFCVNCGREISAQSIEQIADRVIALPRGSRILILAPVRLTAGEAGKSLDEMMRQGFTRVMLDGQNYELAGEIPVALQQATELDLVIDRLVLRDGVEKRLADSLEVAARVGQQTVKIKVLGDDDVVPTEQLVFTQKFACVGCGTTLGDVTPALFSFNRPEGACVACNGTGIEIKRDKRVSHETDVRPCSVCRGTRLGKGSLAVRLGGENIAAFTAASIIDNLTFLHGLELAPERRAVGEKIIAEIASRLRCLAELGLDYLSLDRPATTLSGGELQRVRLATQIGSVLAGVLYILDEPSIGLHQKDNDRLIGLLRRLRDTGNSVVVVEHDPETIRAADYVVDMGPGAGVNGGEVVACGTPAELQKNHRSLTGRYLARELEIALPARRRAGASFLKITGVRQRNLKNLTVQFPIGAMTCVTGVSGAGKSTLVMEVLCQTVSQRLQKRGGKTLESQHISGWENFDRVIAIDQSPIGRTARSNPATFMGVHDHLRELFAQIPEARVRGFKAERFSFNVRGGRCETCQGEGVTRVDMHFLPEMYVTCESCKGRRYNRETLAIKYKGLSIADILDLTVNQAAELLSAVPAIHQRLRMLREVSLSYLTLGQSALTLSGGEAQRLKLARELARRSNGRSLYLLDEPTTGLHFDDIRQLLELLNRLTDLGNTMIIVEHNLEVIKCADFIIDLGPGGGVAGGEIVARGTPEQIVAVAASATGRYLGTVLVPGADSSIDSRT